MCIAIYSKGEFDPITEAEFSECNKSNPDGAGLVYIGDDGNFRIMKTLDCPDVLYHEYIRANEAERDCLLHFRKATHGRIAMDNCHPFWSGEDEVYIHNGVLSLHKIPDDEVDSRVFADRVLRHLPDDWRDMPDIVRMVESFISGSKIVILRKDGDVTILNENSGHWRSDKGVWFSNHSYRVYTKPTTTKQYSYGHYGSYDGFGGYGWWDDDEKWNKYLTAANGKQDKAKDKDESPKSKPNQLVLIGKEEPLVHDDVVYPDDDSSEYYPHGYEVQGYIICTFCMAETLYGDPVVTPVFLGEPTDLRLDTFVCESCGEHVTYESARKAGPLYDPDTEVLLALSADEFESVYSEWYEELEVK